MIEGQKDSLFEDTFILVVFSKKNWFKVVLCTDTKVSEKVRNVFLACKDVFVVSKD